MGTGRGPAGEAAAGAWGPAGLGGDSVWQVAPVLCGSERGHRHHGVVRDVRPRTRASRGYPALGGGAALPYSAFLDGLTRDRSLQGLPPITRSKGPHSSI